MTVSVLIKLKFLLFWPCAFVVILYFHDKKAFKQRWKQFKIKDWK